jgi:hypothetical protein
MEPLDPSVFAPVLTVTLPDVPLFAVPVENVKAPLTPLEDPAFAVARTSPPLLVFSP